MSVYANYGELSKDYDSSRPEAGPGIELYLGLVYSMTKKTAEQIHILDAGCGTGSHSYFLLKEGVDRITMIDASDGMLEKAKTKLKPYIEKGKVEIRKQILPKLDFENNSFDMVMMNQVLHHLTDSSDPMFSNVRAALTEVYRVLKPNGIVIATQCAPNQLQDGFWWYKLLQEVMDSFRVRILNAEQFTHMLAEIGYQKSNAIVLPLDMAISRETYFRKDGPLHDDWMLNNSVTAQTTPKELKNAREILQKLKDEGKLDEYFETADSRRTCAGQYTLYYGKKAA